MKKIILAILLTAISITASADDKSHRELVIEYYKLQYGEDLNDHERFAKASAEKFMKKTVLKHCSNIQAKDMENAVQADYEKFAADLSEFIIKIYAQAYTEENLHKFIESKSDQKGTKVETDLGNKIIAFKNDYNRSQENLHKVIKKYYDKQLQCK